MKKPSIIRTPFLGVSKRPSIHTRGRMSGKGIGNVLLDGGVGGQSSYGSKEDFIETTNWTPMSRNKMRGMGLSNKVGQKLAELNIQKPLSKKKKNIQFSM